MWTSQDLSGLLRASQGRSRCYKVLYGYHRQQLNPTEKEFPQRDGRLLSVCEHTVRDIIGQFNRLVGGSDVGFCCGYRKAILKHMSQRSLCILAMANLQAFAF
jgi:hypothetical protein